MGTMVETMNSEAKFWKGQCWEVHENTYSEHLGLGTKNSMSLLCCIFMISMYTLTQISGELAAVLQL